MASDLPEAELYEQMAGVSIKVVLAGDSENFHCQLKDRHNQKSSCHSYKLGKCMDGMSIMWISAPSLFMSNAPVLFLAKTLINPTITHQNG